MSNTITIQKVLGTIRATKGITAGKKYSTGAVARKTVKGLRDKNGKFYFKDIIVVQYNTRGYDFARKDKEKAMPILAQAFIDRGIVVEYTPTSFEIVIEVEQ
jgi:hypothetical protein